MTFSLNWNKHDVHSLKKREFILKVMFSSLVLKLYNFRGKCEFVLVVVVFFTFLLCDHFLAAGTITVGNSRYKSEEKEGMWLGAVVTSTGKDGKAMVWTM